MSLLIQYPVPEEMKKFPNWVVWGLGGNSLNKFPYNPATGELASSIDPNTWATYEQACAYATKYAFKGIGFVLSQYDPYTIIDLDDPKGNVEIIQQQEAIFRNFYSYAEISPSGKGLHIILKGTLPGRGRRRNNIEIYSQQRFMTMTGNVYRNVDINCCQEEINRLYYNLGGTIKETHIMEERGEEYYDDETLYNIAANAANGKKFVDLWEGRWHEYYPHSVHPTDPEKGASEADYALIDILAYYTDSKPQIIRMFHASALGKRKKAHRQDYLTWMLDCCFDQKLPTVDLSYLIQDITKQIAETNLEIENPKIALKKEKEDMKLRKPSVYEFPPGLVGEIAKFFYAMADRPVKEIALGAALGLMSGIVGRAYNVSNTGLNQYYLILAKTGRGKDIVSKGIYALMNEVKKLSPPADDFLGPGQIASPEALIKHLDGGTNSFVSIMGEFAFVLKQMTMANAPAHILGLRRMLLQIYSMSGKGLSIRPVIYSDKTKNTKSVPSPAISIVGESTPEKFYEILNESLISEGWLPRWVIIEYKGDRVKMNYRHTEATPSYELVSNLASLCANALTLNSTNSVIDVNFTEEGNAIQVKYNEFCDDQINNATAPIRAELWNRAHLKVLKLAAIVAVGINPISPVICHNCMNWAINLVNADCKNILRRFDAGEIGGTADEVQQINKMLEVIVEFLTLPYMKFSKSIQLINKFGIYHAEKIIPYSYLQKRLVGMNVFKEDRLGATGAIKKVIKTLIEMDEIEMLPVPDRRRKFDSLSACYVVKNQALYQDGKRRGFS